MRRRGEDEVMREDIWICKINYRHTKKELTGEEIASHVHPNTAMAPKMNVVMAPKMNVVDG